MNIGSWRSIATATVSASLPMRVPNVQDFMSSPIQRNMDCGSRIKVNLLYLRSGSEPSYRRSRSPARLRRDEAQDASGRNWRNHIAQWWVLRQQRALSGSSYVGIVIGFRHTLG